jgi:hypothetical protein
VINVSRFVVELIRPVDDDPFSVLLDTKHNPPKRVFHDGGEPEDATLDRDLSRLVDLLNKVAEGE